MLLWDIDDYGFLQKKKKEIWKCYTNSKNIPFKFHAISLQYKFFI